MHECAQVILLVKGIAHVDKQRDQRGGWLEMLANGSKQLEHTVPLEGWLWRRKQYLFTATSFLRVILFSAVLNTLKKAFHFPFHSNSQRSCSFKMELFAQLANACNQIPVKCWDTSNLTSGVLLHSWRARKASWRTSHTNPLSECLYTWNIRQKINSFFFLKKNLTLK